MILLASSGDRSSGNSLMVSLHEEAVERRRRSKEVDGDVDRPSEKCR